MTIISILKHFQYRQLWGLFLLSIRYPLYVYPTLKATSQSFLRAKREFPETHGKRGKANAYRHAYWNGSICFECKKWSKNTRGILAWAKLITDKHEQLSPNDPIDEKMDLHNNKIGRNLFISSSFKSLDEISKTIMNKLEFAKKVDQIEDMALYPLDMVYLTEE